MLIRVLAISVGCMRVQAVRSGQYTTVVEWFERLERVGLHTSDKVLLTWA